MPLCSKKEKNLGLKRWIKNAKSKVGTKKNPMYDDTWALLI